jgi:hypothetical protein
MTLDTTCRCSPASPAALCNGAPFKDWVLPAAIERVRRKLANADVAIGSPMVRGEAPRRGAG